MGFVIEKHTVNPIKPGDYKIDGYLYEDAVTIKNRQNKGVCVICNGSGEIKTNSGAVKCTCKK